MNSDHLPIYIEFTLSTNPTNNNTETPPRKVKLNYNKANWTKYASILPSAIPSHIDENNIEELNTFVTESMLNAAKIAIPVKMTNITNVKLLPKYLLDLIEARKKARKMFNKTGLLALKSKYNLLTKTIKQETLDMKNNSWAQFIKKTWRQSFKH